MANNMHDGFYQYYKCNVTQTGQEHTKIKKINLLFYNSLYSISILLNIRH